MITDSQKQELMTKVEEALDKIRPGLQYDGGNCELIDIVDYEDYGLVAQISMMGACAGCPMSTMTLKMGIERTVTAAVPEITAVEAI